MPRSSVKTSGSPTADFFGRAIAFSNKSQREIADAAGFTHPNMVSMMKHGNTKIPIERIPDLANICGVDPALFMRVALQEYHPELLELVETYVGDLLTLNEMRMVDCYRTVTQRDGELEVDTEVKLAVILMLKGFRDRRKRLGR